MTSESSTKNLKLMQSRPALKVLLIFMAGILTGKFFDVSIPILAAFCSLTFFAAFTLWYGDKGKSRLKEFCLLVSLLLCGTILYEFKTTHFSADHIIHYTNTGDSVAIRGVIIRYPERRTDVINLTLAVQEIFMPPKVFAVKGKILITVPKENSQFNYGDEVIVRGRLRKPRDRRNPGEFDYRAYLAAQGIHGIVSNAHVQKTASGGGSFFIRKMVFPVKNYLDNFIQENLPTHESALLSGLMIGERGEIPADLKDSFAKLGVIHILAVSGLHVGFIILIFMGVLGMFRLPYSIRVVLTILALVYYAYLTNLKPPVVRASTMGGLFLIGTVLERKTDAVNILSIAALLLLIANPLDLFQPGFQLSFAAVASIIYIYPEIKKICSGAPLNRLQKYAAGRYPLELLYVSLAAFLGTLPFTILYFNRIPLFSILANLLVIPLAFCGLAAGLVSAAINIFLPAVAKYYLTTTWFCLKAVIEIVEWGGGFRFSYFEVFDFSIWQAAAYFTLIILIVNAPKQRLARVGLVFFTLIVLNILVWSKIQHRVQLEVTYLDVGQGDAALLTLPSDKHLLIDTGPRSFNYDAGRWVIEPFLKRKGIETIDALIISHADSDHLGGAPYLMRSFAIKEVWDNGHIKETNLFREYVRLIDSLNISRRVMHRGSIINDFNPVRICILHPSQDYLDKAELSANDASLSLKISYGETDFIFMGDVEKSGEQSIAEFGELLESEILKVSHHGSRTSSSLDLINQIKPKVAVISIGEFNRFGHPDEEVLQRLSSMNAITLRTDRDAAVLLKSDGRSVEQIFWK